MAGVARKMQGYPAGRSLGRHGSRPRHRQRRRLRACGAPQFSLPGLDQAIAQTHRRCRPPDLPLFPRDARQHQCRHQGRVTLSAAPATGNGGIQMSASIDHPRRRFLGAAAVALAAGELVMAGGGNVWAASGETDIGGERRFGATGFVRSGEADRRRLAQHRLCRGGSCRRPARHPAARLALRHPHLCGGGTAARGAGLSGHRALSARLWQHTVPVGEDAAQRTAIGGRGRYRRSHGCARHRAGDPRRLRLGRQDRKRRSPRSGPSAARPWCRSAAI